MQHREYLAQNRPPLHAIVLLGMMEEEARLDEIVRHPTVRIPIPRPKITRPLPSPITRKLLYRDEQDRPYAKLRNPDLSALEAIEAAVKHYQEHEQKQPTLIMLHAIRYAEYGKSHYDINFWTCISVVCADEHGYVDFDVKVM